LALRDDSPAYSLPGFERIPFDRIGPPDSGTKGTANSETNVGVR